MAKGWQLAWGRIMARNLAAHDPVRHDQLLTQRVLVRVFGRPVSGRRKIELLSQWLFQGPMPSVHIALDLLAVAFAAVVITDPAYATPAALSKDQLAIEVFEIDYRAKYFKAVANIVDAADVLSDFYTYPTEHWIHLRTTNPIESRFSTVGLRTKVTKRPGSRACCAGRGLQSSSKPPRH